MWPLGRIRKTAWIAVFLFVVFLATRFLDLDPSVSSILPEPIPLSVDSMTFEVCANIVDGEPFGVDSVFSLNSQVYAFSRVPNTGLISHHWYLDSALILKVDCLVGAVCISSLGNLRASGEWSLDLVRGNTLLDTRQFQIESASPWSP